MKTPARLITGAFLSMWFLGIGFLSAQSNSEINSGIQFNFSSPGARSLGLAGAFVGLADDATAAYTNPGGLTNLSRPEVFIEGRRFQYESEFLSAGSASGTPSGNGVDDIDGPVFYESTNIVNDVSFGSFTYPLGRFCMAVYYHRLADFEASAKTEGAFFADPSFPDGRNRLFPTQSSIDLTISSIGVAFAYQIVDGLSLGVGVAGYQYRQNTALTRYILGAKYSPANYDVPLNRETARGDDEAVAFNGGIIWKPSRKISVGAVFRQGPEFQATVTDTLLNPDGTVNRVILDTTGEFHVPDIFAIGIAFSPTDSLTITADYDRVWYSQLTDGMVDVLTGQDRAVGYEVPDGNEAHLGAQYTIPICATTLAIRAGGWFDPDHKIRYVLPAPPGQAVLFTGGEDVWHVTGGLGAAIGEHFQIDVAGDFSDTVNIGSVSAVVRF